MIFLPAIDIKDGKCVRLSQGDYATARQVADDAIKAACSFRKAGARWLHVVDLDGAKAARPENAGLILRIAETSGLKVEVGGGIRGMDAVDFYLSHGISRVILGTAAIRRPEFVRQAVEKYPDRIAVGIDEKNGVAVQNGWTQASAVGCLALAKKMESIGVKYIIFTDVSRDGMLEGPNMEMLASLCQTVRCNVIASGGVSSASDLKNLCSLPLYGVICGKAVYTGDVDLKEALSICGED